MLNIAINTFREIIRNKFLYLILFFGLCFILFSLLLGQLSLGEDSKLIVDFGLAMIEIFGLIGVLFVGSQLLFKEIEGKTIFLILSKPIYRYEFILGKFFGFGVIIGLIVFFQSALFLLVLSFKDIDIIALIYISLLFTLLKLEILLSLLFFFSTFMSHILTILVTIMIYFVSHSFASVLEIGYDSKNNVLISLFEYLELLFPPFQALNIKDYIGSFTQFSYQLFVFNGIYSLIYLCIILFLTILIFNYKKFEN